MVRIHPDPPGCEMARIASQSRREAPTCTRPYARRRPTKHGEARGAVAQLGERLLCKQEVIGSIPFSSTNNAWEVDRRYPSNPERLQASVVVCFWSFGQSDSVVLDVRLFFNKTEEVKRTRRSIVVCWVRLYRPDLPRVLGGWVSQTPVTQCLALWDQATKCMWWMPWRSQAMKDVAACVKPRGAGKRALIRGCPNGETRPARVTAT